MINQPRTFGAFVSGAADASSTSSKRDLPKATTWLNVGYSVGEGDDAKFVSLPIGIALDTQEPLAIPRSPEFAQFRAAQNDLLAQLQAEAAKLAPGEETVIGVGNGLSIQLRRVNDAPTTPATDESNPFARKFAFTGE